jgi:hypothetical protein
MSDKPADIVARAENHLGKRQFAEAAKCFEEAAAAETEGTRRAGLLQRAGAAFLEDRSIKDAGRCYWQLSTLLEKQDKADTLMVYWRAIILAIAGSLYDCNFEWKGEPDHHEDHRSYQRDVQEYQEEAERVLAEILRIQNVDRNAVMEEARAECRRRQKDGGWGAAECREIITRATPA